MKFNPKKLPSWSHGVLLLAGLYNFLWGGLAVLVPQKFLGFFGLEPARYPEFWQCIGMIVGVYGIGYLIAATNPVKHWPIVLVGFLGKTFGPLGFAWSLYQQVFPPSFFWNIIFNDLIWWVPFLIILMRVKRIYHDREAALQGDPIRRLSESLAGKRLLEQSEAGPVMLVFLRHTGCTFCRESLQKLSEQQERLKQKFAGIGLIHMSDEDEFKIFASQYSLQAMEFISDPERKIYRSFGLSRGHWRQLFGLKVIWRGLVAAVRGGHGVGALEGDGFQMPGTFVLYQREVMTSFPARTAADTVPVRQLMELSIS